MKENKLVIFVAIIVIVVAVFAVIGFILAGSPAQQRMVRLDQQRLSDLQLMQSNIVNYWDVKEELPESYGDVLNEFQYLEEEVDPETGMAYSYTRKGELTFELCADFTLESRDGRTVGVLPLYLKGKSWEYMPGRNCFERTIDANVYRDNFSNRIPPRELPPVVY